MASTSCKYHMVPETAANVDEETAANAPQVQSLDPSQHSCTGPRTDAASKHQSDHSECENASKHESCPLNDSKNESSCPLEQGKQPQVSTPYYCKPRAALDGG